MTGISIGVVVRLLVPVLSSVAFPEPPFVLTISCKRVEALVNLARSFSDVDELLTGNDHWLESCSFTSTTV